MARFNAHMKMKPILARVNGPTLHKGFQDLRRACPRPLSAGYLSFDQPESKGQLTEYKGMHHHHS